MQPEFWSQKWEKNEIGFHQEKTNPYLQKFITRLKRAGGKGHIFVPLCGKSKDMIYLRSQGCGVLGLEISPLAVEAFFEENHFEPVAASTGRFAGYQCQSLKILCGDFFNLRSSDLVQATAVYDRASLIAMPPKLRKRYARLLSAVLPQNVSILLVTMEYPADEMKGPPFPRWQYKLPWYLQRKQAPSLPHEYCIHAGY